MSPPVLWSGALPAWGSSVPRPYSAQLHVQGGLSPLYLPHLTAPQLPAAARPQIVLTCLKRHWMAVRAHSQVTSKMRTEQLQQQRLYPALEGALSRQPGLLRPNGL